MGRKKAFGLQSLVLCVFFNGLLVACLYWTATQAFTGPYKGASAPGTSGMEGTSVATGGALAGIEASLEKNPGRVAPAVFGFGGVVTLALWVALLLTGGRLLGGEPAGKGAGPVESSLSQEVKRLEKELQSLKKAASKPSPAPAIQILSILQRQGRLIDFLEEDLSLYEDGQIGAAVRSIHQGCKEALSQNVSLETVLGEEEGAKVKIEPGFDPRAVRLTGNVQGDPPFHGTLRHRGWRVVRVDLPMKAPDQETEWILAPAEVELGD